MSQKNEEATEMNKAQEIEGVAFIADHQSAKIAQPGEEAFDLPAASIAPQWAAILRFRALAVAPMRGNHLHLQLGQRLIQPVRIVGAVTNEALGQRLYKAGVESGGDQGDLVRRSRGGTSGERKTSAVCHCHELRTLAPLGFSHTVAPFLAPTKVPSMKHSDRSSLPRALRSAARAANARSNVPARPHAWNRRWQVWYGGYRSGKSFQGAPVRKIHKMP